MNIENNVTIIIKTFIRIKCVERLLKSIEKFYSKYPIIICDDSGNAERNKNLILNEFKNLNITYLITEENIGLSKGRNILVDNVKTKYFLLCDDDFIFYKKTDIVYAKQIIEKHNYDILGGLCLHAFRINYGSKNEKIELFMRSLQKLTHYYRKVGYRGKIIQTQKNKIEIKIKKMNYCSKKTYDTDICENFFLANTDKVRSVKWYDKLKLNEHEDFFIRAKKQGLKIGVTTGVKIYHYPEVNNTFKRHREMDYYKYVLENNELEELKIERNNVGIIQTYLLEDGKLKKIQKYKDSLLGKIKEMYYNNR